MSDIIQLLPDSVANQIAAGEVIQRPASVVKELVENAVDAEATEISIAITDAGRTCIQVIDNGKGMSETDARLAFERHATSKIRKADDLFTLHTMGFRGEALPSIVAVSQVDLKTRLRGDEVGTHLTLSGSRFQGQEPCACPEGSNFKIESLFFNVPARRKFLKSNTTELGNIITAFQRIALVYPKISFNLSSNEAPLFNLRPGNTLQRIEDIFGKQIGKVLLPVNVNTTLCKVTGYVGKPESARKKGAQQYFFVNGRYMRHPYFSKAVMSAFDRMVPAGEQVPYFLYFEVPPQNIDVNIHPTKTEIKFENEQAIWQLLAAAVKEAIGLFSNVPTIDFDTEDRPDIPTFNAAKGIAEAPRLKYNPDYNPFKESPQPGMQPVQRDWQKLYEQLPTAQEEQPSLFDETEQAQSLIEERSPLHYQYKGRYIMTAVKSGLMIIDQHRAHVRILYEQYLKEPQSPLPSQKEMFPEMLHLGPSEEITLTKVLPELKHMGFELTALGNGDYSINGVPSGLDGLRYPNLIQEMLAQAKDTPTASAEALNRNMSLALARNAAIPQGQVLGNDEMESIINQLFQCSNPNYTPDGKPILCILRQQEIEHLLS